MFNATAQFFGNLFLPLFKIGAIAFLVIIIPLAGVLIWQKLRQAAEYKQFQAQQELNESQEE